MNLRQVVRAARRIYIETAPFIYFIEDHPQFAPFVDEVLEIVDEQKLLVVTSVITLTEVLQLPFRTNRHDLVNAYRSLLQSHELVQLISVNEPIAEEAARLRAQYRLRTPDALHLATALSAQCDVFVSNDAGFAAVRNLHVLNLYDFA